MKNEVSIPKLYDVLSKVSTKMSQMERDFHSIASKLEGELLKRQGTVK